MRRLGFRRTRVRGRLAPFAHLDLWWIRGVDHNNEDFLTTRTSWFELSCFQRLDRHDMPAMRASNFGRHCGVSRQLSKDGIPNRKAIKVWKGVPCLEEQSELRDSIVETNVFMPPSQEMMEEFSDFEPPPSDVGSVEF